MISLLVLRCVSTVIPPRLLGYRDIQGIIMVQACSVFSILYIRDTQTPNIPYITRNRLRWHCRRDEVTASEIEHTSHWH